MKSHHIINPALSRRSFLSAAASVAATGILLPCNAPAAPAKLRIRKSLKWGMVKSQSLPLVEAFRKLKTCGFDGVEPTCSQVKNADEWVAASKESGLVIDGVTGAGERGIEAALDLCKKLGGDSVLVTARTDPKKPYWDTWRETQAIIKAAAPHAEQVRVKILIENVWASFLISPLDMMRYVDEIGHPWVGVHYDVGNVMRWGVSEHWIQVLGKRIGKLDIKEYNLPVAMKEGMIAGFKSPLGEGSINWAGVREELAKIEFSGWAAAEVAAGDWDNLADLAKRMDKVLGLA
ncbi:MAG: sugar phosphate isomerase/epimerase [Verrucomicrobia bacterium]|nr:sugar phosphate isomerase/epimerase [Verrucomicrobiota bacterium]